MKTIITFHALLLVLLLQSSLSKAQVWSGSTVPTTTTDEVQIEDYVRIGPLGFALSWYNPSLFINSNPLPGETTTDQTSISINNWQQPGADKRNIMEVFRGDLPNPFTNIETPFIISTSGKVGINMQPDEAKDYKLEVDGTTNLEHRVNIGNKNLNYSGDFILNVDGKSNFTNKVVIGDAGLNHGFGSVFNLYVETGILTEKVQVLVSGSWPDYVFEPEYKLTSLKETEAYIKTNKHLPGVPSAAEVKDKGISLGDMDATLLQKIEELTLHMIELQKQNEVLQARLAQLEK